jgi:DNA recombination protein RmuC
MLQKSEMEDVQKKLITEFENLANKILKQNTLEFTASNQKNIDELLKPLKEKLGTFEKMVSDTYEKGLKDQTDLKAELKKLYELNNRISEEAHNLTRALKGDVKKQGNWGEMVLERVLERSGLSRGREYEMQVSTTNAEGSRIQPDVVVFLPDKKHLIVDSKVSLVAYEKYVNAITDEDRAQFMKEHLLSIKTHIRGLSEKHYHTSPDLNTPDFVLLFVAIESSFSMAIQADQELFNYAWDNKVVMVSPSTLLATLRTIESMWKQEYHARNAQEIARRSGEMLDKFVGFVEDMEKVGKGIDGARDTWSNALNKLSTGRGNLISKATFLKELGVTTKKSLPEKFKLADDEQDEHEEN